MKFINGLKGVFKKPLYVFIVSAFTLTWLLIIANSYFSSVFLGLASSKILPITVAEEMQILQAGGLFAIFVFFNLLFGIYSILAQKK